MAVAAAAAAAAAAKVVNVASGIGQVDVSASVGVRPSAESHSGLGSLQQR